MRTQFERTAQLRAARIFQIRNAEEYFCCLAQSEQVKEDSVVSTVYIIALLLTSKAIFSDLSLAVVEGLLV